MIMLALVLSAGLTSCDDVTGAQDNPVTPTPTPTPTPAPTYASDLERPLTFEAAMDGVKVTFKFKSGAKPDYKKVEYSLDQGATWTALKRRSQSILLEKAGDMVMFRGDNPTYNGDARFVTELVNAKARGITRGYETVGAYIYASGNTNSLLVMDGYSDKKELTEPFTFKEMFKGSNININKGHELKLPATNNTVGCYQGMFADNEYLEVAPVLGAKKLVDKCYVGTFENDLRLGEVTLGANSVEDGVMVKDCIDGIVRNAGTALPVGVEPAIRIEEGTNEELNMQNVTVAEANEIIQKEQEEADQVIRDIQNVISAMEDGDPGENQWKIVFVDENGVEHEIESENPDEGQEINGEEPNEDVQQEDVQQEEGQQGDVQQEDVNVEDPKIGVNSVSIDQKTLSLEIGATATLIAIITPDNAPIKSITWTSKDTKIATVTTGSDGKATVTAVAAGSTKIELTVVPTYSNSGGTWINPTCLVTVTEPEPEPEPEPENPVIDSTDDFVEGGDPLN